MMIIIMIIRVVVLIEGRKRRKRFKGEPNSIQFIYHGLNELVFIFGTQTG